jgi:ELWxxDGT repeat protein
LGLEATYTRDNIIANLLIKKEKTMPKLVQLNFTQVFACIFVSCVFTMQAACNESSVIFDSYGDIDVELDGAVPDGDKEPDTITEQDAISDGDIDEDVELETEFEIDLEIDAEQTERLEIDETEVDFEAELEQDSDIDCEEGDQRLLEGGCGLNGYGVLVQICESGSWRNAECSGDDICVNGEYGPEREECGLLDRGWQYSSICVEGELKPFNECVDPDRLVRLSDFPNDSSNDFPTNLTPYGSGVVFSKRWEGTVYRYDGEPGSEVELWPIDGLHEVSDIRSTVRGLFLAGSDDDGWQTLVWIDRSGERQDLGFWSGVGAHMQPIKIEPIVESNDFTMIPIRQEGGSVGGTWRQWDIIGIRFLEFPVSGQLTDVWAMNENTPYYSPAWPNPLSLGTRIAQLGAEADVYSGDISYYLLGIGEESIKLDAPPCSDPFQIPEYGVALLSYSMVEEDDNQYKIDVAMLVEDSENGGMKRHDTIYTGTASIENEAPMLAGRDSKVFKSSGNLFFSIWVPETGAELWTSDGSPGGAHLVFDLIPGQQDGWPLSSDPKDFIELNGKVYFSATLWQFNYRSLHYISVDGQGGIQTMFTYPGPDDIIDPQEVTVLGDYLFFSSDLWFGDRKVCACKEDCYIIGPASQGNTKTEPKELVVSEDGRRLFFTADDGLHGRQVWMFEMGDELP